MRGRGQSALRRAVYGAGGVRPANPRRLVLRADVFAAVCPLGAVQELVAVRPIRTPRWLDHVLGLLPYIYLGAAVVFATTGVGDDRGPYIICKYDPFVGLFRMSASATMLTLGLGFLALGFFVGRPYCRYVCPLGAILKLCSRVSKRHVRIPPEECIKCKLCEDACPYGAILEPTVEQSPQERLKGRRRLAILLAAFPLLVAASAGLGFWLGVPLARLHPQAALAELVHRAAAEAQGADGGEASSSTLSAADRDKIEAFANTRRPAEELYAEARTLHAELPRPGRGWAAGSGWWWGSSSSRSPSAAAATSISPTAATASPAADASGIAPRNRSGWG